MKAAVRKRKPAPAESYTPPLVLRTRPALDLSEDQFFALCQLNRDLQIERNAEGEWLIMSPTGFETGQREAEIIFQLSLWAKRDKTGLVCSPSTGFRLLNTAVRAPDAAWVLRSRLDAIPAEQRAKFLPLCPDFALELRSPTDRLVDVQAKMAEYLANGARLGGLLDPEHRHVYVYRPDGPVARLDRPESVAGDPVLPGFVLDLREIW
jgi:Uma2 family endonuclease